MGPGRSSEVVLGALWQLAPNDKNKIAMVTAGIIPPLVTLLSSYNDESREHSVAVLATLARAQTGNKKAIVNVLPR